MRKLLQGRNIPTDCATSNYPRLIPTAETWRFLQLSYQKIVRQNLKQKQETHDQQHKDRHGVRRYHSRRLLHSDNQRYNKESHTDIATAYESGMEIYMEVKEGPRGRGVFVTEEAVAKGTQVWAPGPNTYATFNHPEEFLDFMELLPHDLQCDVLLWTYSQGHKVHVELSEGSFINHADEPELVNIDINCYALREIAVGEELLMDYSEFIEKLDWCDDVRAYAWADLACCTY